MTEPPLHAALQHLRRATDGADVSDAELLRRFHHSGDQAAFELLAWRHQRLVFQVCRRVLPQRQDAEDAFQATFLALARRAGALDGRRPLAAWLHSVAYHAALRVRKQATRQARVEAAVAVAREPAYVDPPAPAEQAESQRALRRTLDAEIERLPERYRLPVILCCLKGINHAQAAEQLGCPVGTLAARLSRARERLRSRLARLGIGVALLDLVLAQEAPAAERAALVATVARTAADLHAGRALAPAIARLVPLADGVLRGLRLARWRLPAVAALALVCVLAAGAFRWLPAADELTPQAPPALVVIAAPQPVAPAEGDRPPADALGDPLPLGAVARLGTVRQWNPEGIRAVAVSADAKLLATACLPGRIRVWNAADGKLLREMGPERVKVKGVQEEVALIDQMEFSPDGKWLATLEHIRVVRVWEVATGKELYTVTGPPAAAGMRAFAFTPRGDQVVLGALRGDLVVWDLATDKQAAVLKGHTADVLALAFSADGKYLVSGGFDQKVRRWEWQAAKPGGDVVTKHDNYVIAVAVADDGKRVASSGYDARVRVWDAAKGQEILQFQPYKEGLGETVALRVFLSSDGKRLWAGGGAFVGCWRVDTNERVEMPAGCVGLPAMTPDAKMLAAGTDRLRLWDVATGKPVADFAGHDRLPAAAALSPDGSLAVTATQFDRAMYLWDARTGKLLRTLKGPENGPVWLLFAADGKTLFATGRTGPGRAIGRWDVATGQELEPLDDDATMSWVQAALAPDGKTLAAIDRRGILRAYDLIAGKVRFSARFAPELKDKNQGPLAAPALRFLGPGDRIATAALVISKQNAHALSATQFATASGKPTAEWSIPTYKLTFVAIFHEDTLAPTPDGAAVLVANQRGEVHRVTARGGDLLSESKGRRPSPSPRTERQNVLPLQALFSPDGRMLATTGCSDTLVIFETATGGERLRLTADQGLLHALAFSADGTRLLSLGSDTTALVWDLGTIKAGPPLTADRLAALWDDLASADAGVAWKAMRELLTSPSQTVALVKQYLKPAPVATEKQIEDWVRALGDAKFAVRQKATVELERAGTTAAPRLRQALEGKLPLEEEQRIRKLLETIESGRPPASRLRELRAVELLERIHTAEARQLLDALAGGGAGDLVTQDARAARVRLAAAGK